MQPNEALNILKQLMDAACKAGIFQNMESAATAANAFNVVAEALQPKKED